MSKRKIQGQRTATDRSREESVQRKANRGGNQGIEIREGEKSEEKGKGECEIYYEECYYTEVDF